MSTLMARQRQDLLDEDFEIPLRILNGHTWFEQLKEYEPVVAYDDESYLLIGRQGEKVLVDSIDLEFKED